MLLNILIFLFALTTLFYGWLNYKVVKFVNAETVFFSVLSLFIIVFMLDVFDSAFGFNPETITDQKKYPLTFLRGFVEELLKASVSIFILSRLSNGFCIGGILLVSAFISLVENLNLLSILYVRFLCMFFPFCCENYFNIQNYTLSETIDYLGEVPFLIMTISQPIRFLIHFSLAYSFYYFAIKNRYLVASFPLFLHAAFNITLLYFDEIIDNNTLKFFAFFIISAVCLSIVLCMVGIQDFKKVYRTVFAKRIPAN